jgi:hypothetical protein
VGASSVVGPEDGADSVRVDVVDVEPKVERILTLLFFVKNKPLDRVKRI